MPLLAEQYSNLDAVYKYKKFYFSQEIERNPNCRWCPECSKSNSRTTARQNEVRRLSEKLDPDGGPTTAILGSGNSSPRAKLIADAVQHRKELFEQREQIITVKGYEIKPMKFDGSCNRAPSMDSMQIQNELKKKANSCLTRTNQYYGQCARCNYEICMRCGLPYHRQKNCKS